MMEATEFIEAKQTMCDTYTTCEGCPVYEAFRDGKTFYDCDKAFLNHTTKAVALVENWWKENKPKVKTNADWVAEQLTLLGYEADPNVLKFTCPPLKNTHFCQHTYSKCTNVNECSNCQDWWEAPHTLDK